MRSTETSSDGGGQSQNRSSEFLGRLWSDMMNSAESLGGGPVVLGLSGAGPMCLSKMWRGLRVAGWIPSRISDAIENEQSSNHCKFTCNLLEILGSAWTAALDADTERREKCRGERIGQWIQQQRQSGSSLTFGIPGRSVFGGAADAGLDLQSRFVFWTCGIPNGSWTAIVSSRLGRRIELHAEWLEAFRFACQRVHADDAVILTASGTVTDRFVGPAAELYGLRSLTIREPRRGETLQRWFARLASANFLNRLGQTPQAIVSPIVSPDVTETEMAGQLRPGVEPDGVPWRDRALAALVTRLFVLHVRRGGNVEKLTRWRLRDPANDPSSVILAQGHKLIPADLTAEFLELGAASFVPSRRAIMEAKNKNSSSTRRATQCIHGHPGASAQILGSVAIGEWQYLTHCTRGQTGPWPDQTESDYVKELLISPYPSERTSLSSLRRILDTRKIVATVRTLRGRVPAVCLSAVPPAELSRLRVFRPHRGCWDFEPYGICIHRDWLIERGSRPVIYGDDADWEKLTIEDRPFFQRRFTRGRRTGHITDWSVECEWRHVGDVDLTQLPSDMALLLVATRDEADALAKASLWPILVLGRLP